MIAYRISIRAVAIAIAFLYAGCLPAFFPRRHLKETLSPQDVMGRWYLCSSASRMLSRHGILVPAGQEAVIDLESNRRCMFRSFDSHGRYIATNGTWELLHDVKFNSPKAEKNTLRIVVVPGDREFIVNLSFAKQHHQVVMWDYYDDPDGEEYIEYCRDARN
jgi:hypothetical protein